MAGSLTHGGRAAGMGTTFIGLADDPSAILFNPAGLTSSKGVQIYFGSTAIILSSTYDSPGGGSENTDSQIFFPPHLYISSDFGYKDMVLGVGVFAPFGFGGRKWPETGLTRYRSTMFETSTLTINPTLAFKATQTLSIGIGINHMKSFIESENMIDQSIFGASDGKLRLKGDGRGFGYNFGLLYDLEKIGIGLAYRSHIRVNMKGNATLKSIAPPLQPAFGGSRFDTDTKTSLRFPEIWSLGVAYRTTKRLTLVLDYELLRWSSLRKMDIDFETEVPPAGFTDYTIVLDWKDASQIKVGTEYRLNEKFTLRGGYAFIETYAPEHTLDPGNPDADMHSFSVGFGYKHKNFVIDAFYNTAFYESRRVNNSILSGKYESFIHSTGFSVGYTF